ncbi:DgyrCDS9722 [Dimorphilus gyrociliatus]|uniref:DgyrCDS9722 n=1 Tax=Dimorphilus gyrociliatus TaxID=2664684 RepID=A0A7I8VY73_9ANNE|nr:DgyrCDS9722 [Dimorphilus gyrociliatus]
MEIINSFTDGYVAVIFSMIISLSSATEVGWNPLEIVLVEGGQQKTAAFGVLSGRWPSVQRISCTFEDDLPSQLTTKTQFNIPGSPNFGIKSHPFILTLAGRVVRVKFQAGNDNACENKVYSLKVQCKQQEITINFPTIKVIVTNTKDSSMCNDPHLNQKVKGIDEDGRNVTRNICYDVYGTEGDQMELISDAILGTSIVVELRDDYFIGKVFFSSKLGLLNVTTTAISNRGQKITHWGKEDLYVIGEITTHVQAVLKLSLDNLIIEYNDGKRCQSIRIVRIQQTFGKSYLNVLIEKSTNKDGVFDKHHGGIFGSIANQQYQFCYPVQGEENVTVVKINGRFVKAFLKDKPDQDHQCYLISIQDLLFPKHVSSFQKSL